jgi:hypothetical protein
MDTESENGRCDMGGLTWFGRFLVVCMGAGNWSVLGEALLYMAALLGRLSLDFEPAMDAGPPKRRSPEP